MLGLRTWVSEGVRSSIKHEYDLRLEAAKGELSAQQALMIERVRADVAERSSLQAASMAALAEGHKAAHEYRLKAIDSIWSDILRLRRETPAIGPVCDILLESEIKDHLARPNSRL